MRVKFTLDSEDDEALARQTMLACAETMRLCAEAIRAVAQAKAAEAARRANNAEVADAR